MSEKHFGESGEVKKAKAEADEQMTEQELNELLEGGVPKVTEEELKAAEEGVQKRMDEENPER